MHFLFPKLPGDIEPGLDHHIALGMEYFLAEEREKIAAIP